MSAVSIAFGFGFDGIGIGIGISGGGDSRLVQKNISVKEYQRQEYRYR